MTRGIPEDFPGEVTFKRIPAGRGHGESVKLT